MDVQSVVDPAHVETDRIDAQSELFGATFVAVTFGQKLQNPHLAWRQLDIRLAGRGYWRKAMPTLRAISGDIGAPPPCSSRMESRSRRGSVSLSR